MKKRRTVKKKAKTKRKKNKKQIIDTNYNKIGTHLSELLKNTSFMDEIKKLSNLYGKYVRVCLSFKNNSYKKDILYKYFCNGNKTISKHENERFIKMMKDSFLDKCITLERKIKRKYSVTDKILNYLIHHPKTKSVKEINETIFIESSHCVFEENRNSEEAESYPFVIKIHRDTNPKDILHFVRSKGKSIIKKKLDKFINDYAFKKHSLGIKPRKKQRYYDYIMELDSKNIPPDIIVDEVDKAFPKQFARLSFQKKLFRVKQDIRNETKRW